MTVHTVYQAGKPIQQEWNFCQTCGKSLENEHVYSEPVCSKDKAFNDAETRKVQRNGYATMKEGYHSPCYQYNVETGMPLQKA